ncbi:MAG: deoxyribonuclease IV, partial [Candidatus Hodarchaeota archaeon]
MLLGAHVSISGGIFNAPVRGEKIGCSAIQIFTKNQMQWKAKDLIDNEIEKFKTEIEKSTIKSIIAHDSYLINLGSPDKDKLEKSRESFGIEMQRTEALGIPFLVFHPGSHLDAGEQQGIRIIAESLNILLNKYQNFKLLLLLETTAGQGSNLGYRFEQLAEIIDIVEQRDQVGICFDTAHVFAAGYDIRTKEAYEKTFDEFDNILG